MCAFCDEKTAQISTRGSTVITRIEAGIDWLSASYSASNDEYAAIAELWQSTAETEMAEGNKAAIATLNGYYGFRAGKVFFGTRDDGCFVNISSGAAHRYFEVINTPKAQFTRIDVQATLQYNEEQPNVGRNAYNALSRVYRTRNGGNKRKPRIYNELDGGCTVYVGKPASRHYGRIYDKYAESGEEYYRHAWRYECVFKGELCDGVLRKIARTSARIPQSALNIVGAYWREEGVNLHLYRGTFGPSIARPRIPESDVSSKLKWLRTQVNPSIAFLVNKGYIDDVIDALGLSKHVQPIEREE